MKNALSGAQYVKKEMETFRPEEPGIFKHLPPECQRNYERVGFTVEDEISAKFGPVMNACRECAGPEIVSSSRICASRECIEVGKFAQSEKSRETERRYTRANRLFNNQGTTAMVERFGQIHLLEVNYSNS